MSQTGIIEESDKIIFEEESNLPPLKSSLQKPWKILIADDDEQTHLVTKLALSDITIFDRDIEFLHAYSSIEAFSILKENRDITVILLDVVMETENAGLDLVKKIREEHKRAVILSPPIEDFYFTPARALGAMSVQKELAGLGLKQN